MKSSLMAVVASVFAVGVARAETVPADGLLQAVSAAQPGDVLLLDAVEYQIDDELLIDKAITLRGAGMDETVIRQTGEDRRVLTLDCKDARVEGCTLTGGNLTTEHAVEDPKKGGCGVLIWENGGTLEGCRITGNQTSRNHNRGIGIDEHSADALVKDCIVDHNVHTKETSFAGSFAGISAISGTYRHCLIVDNRGQNGGGVYVGGAATFSDCTIAGNHAPDGFGAVAIFDRACVFTNCVIAGNFTSPADTSETAPEYSFTYPYYGFFYNCAFPNTVTIDDTGIRGSPFQCDVYYVDAANGDYRQRLVSGARDIGYYAPYDYETFACDFLPSAQSVLAGDSLTLMAAVTGVGDGDEVAYTWTVTRPDGTVDELQGGEVLYAPSGIGAHSVKLSVLKNGTGDPAECIQEDCFTVSSPAVSVSDVSGLMAAVASAGEGSVIRCAAGTYDLTEELVLGKGVHLIGDGYETTTLRQTALKTRVIKLNHELDHVEGFTLTGGNSGDNTKACKIESYHGFGAYIGPQGGTLEKCRVTGNTTYNNINSGIGVYMLGDGLVTHCVITNNCYLNGTAQLYGGGVYAEAGVVDNCLIAGNRVYNYGGGVYLSGSATLRSCTVAGNYAGVGGAGVYSGSANVRCVNCIFARNESSSSDTTVGKPEWTTGKSCKINCENSSFPTAVQFDTKVTGSYLSLDPVFVAPEAGDYHVQSSSPTIDKTEAYEGLSETDLDDTDRLKGDGLDLGCYEFDASVFSVSFQGPADPRGFVGRGVPYQASVSGVSSGATVSYDWTFTSPSGAETKDVGEAVTLLPTVSGEWTVSVVATADGRTSDPYVETYSARPAETYVVEATAAAAAKSAWPYDSWDTAATNLCDALNLALNGSVVNLGEGLIAVTCRIDLVTGVTLAGRGWRKTTLRQQESSVSVLCVNDANAVVRGMTISGLRAAKTLPTEGRGAVMIEAQGGVVEDCRITDNLFTGDAINHACGVGITINSPNGICRRCIIDRNRGSNGANNDRGGGVQGLEGLLENCLVCFNTNKLAGGICIRGSTKGGQRFTVRNCTVYGNVGIGVDSDIGWGKYGVGGIGFESGVGIVENTIVFGNSSPNQSWESGGYPEWRDNGNGGSLSFVNSLLPQGVTWPVQAVACLNGDPLFRNVEAEDFHLPFSSPAVNAGAILDYAADSLDLDGKRRVYRFGTRSAAPDMGCYELQYGMGLLLIMR